MKVHILNLHFYLMQYKVKGDFVLRRAILINAIKEAYGIYNDHKLAVYFNFSTFLHNILKMHIFILPGIYT